MADMLMQADEMQTTIDTMTRMTALMGEMSATTHSMVEKTRDMTVDIAELRDDIANFDDFFRPIRNYFYWEPHCFNIPICWSLRSIFDTLDGVDTTTDDVQALLPDLERLDALMPQLLALMPQTDRDHEDDEEHDAHPARHAGGHAGSAGRACRRTSRRWAMRSTTPGTTTRSICPPRSSTTKSSSAGMDSFISPNGHAVRMIISHEGDPLSTDGIARIDAIKQAAKEAIKGTPLEGSKIYIGGTASASRTCRRATTTTCSSRPSSHWR